MADGNLNISAIVNVEQLQAGTAVALSDIKAFAVGANTTFDELALKHKASVGAISENTKAMAAVVSPAFKDVAEASLEVSLALREQRSAMAAARATAGEDVDTMNVLAAVKQRLATATLELAEAQQVAGIRTDNLGRATGEATGALALMGDEIGLHLNRHLRNFAAELPAIGPLMASAFNAFAIIGLVELLPQLAGKITEVTDQIAGLTKGVKDQYDSVVKYNEYLMEHFSDNKIGQGYLNFNSLQLAANEQQIASLKDLRAHLDTSRNGYIALAMGAAEFIAATKKINELTEEDTKLTAQADAIRGQMHSNSQKSAEDDSKAKQKAIDDASREYNAQERTNQEILRSIAERDDRISNANKRVAKEKETQIQKEVDDFRKATDEVLRITSEADKKRAEQARRTNAEIEDSDVEHAKNLLRIKTEELNFDVAIGQITTAKKIASLKQYEQQEYESEKLALQAKLALYNQDTVEYQRVLKQLQALDDQHRQQQLNLDRQAALERTQIWRSFANSIGTTFHTSITGMIQGTQNFQKAFKKMGADILAGFIDTLYQMEIQWRLTHAVMSIVSKIFHLDQLAQDATGNAQKVALNAATNIQEVISASGVAFANAYAAYAAFPPIAAAMGAQAQGTVLGIGLPLASAAGGMVVERSEQLALLHKNEMVLPSDIAGPLRHNLSSGGSGGPNAQDFATAVRNALRGARFGPSADDVADAVVRKFKREFGRNG